MTLFIKKTPDTAGKLAILARDSQYDLACACGINDNEHRQRSKDDKWIYPVILPNGGRTYLFKTLLSNDCANNCKYCPLRANADANRCSLAPEELVKTFLSYYRARRVSGLFLSSAVMANPDTTMERINRAALILRKMQFRGYIHLKIIPGAAEEAIRQSLSLASAVSLNIETAGEENFKILSTTKDYIRDIIQPMQLISRLSAKGSSYGGVKQTTQFVVGASRETDREIIRYSWGLYKKLGLSRVYFSAYQRGAGSPDLPGECSGLSNRDLLTREHRLYQVDWLLRKYGFKADEIPVEAGGNLSLETDPKEMWAKTHPEFFPVNINQDDKYRLLRVPGLGQIMVARILAFRQNHTKIRSLEDLGRRNKILNKALAYVTV
ncbi:MAG: helix-hairpin-helix domain-containing protein [Kiritimatiellia bacterium]|nr:helix-hairpin-helix domain-containing protein [Kiritimatiellia bacterium]